MAIDDTRNWDRREEYGKSEAQVSVYVLKLYSGFILFRHGKTADMTLPKVTWRWTTVNQKAKAEEEHGSPITLWHIDGETMKTVRDFIFLGSKITAYVDCSHEKMLPPWKKSYDKHRQCVKKQRHYFANKSFYSQSYGFSSRHVLMWELNHKEGWVLKNWCFQNVVLGTTLDSPLDSKEFKTINPKGNQSWIFIGKTDSGAKAPILWPPDAKSWLIGKNPDAVKDAGGEGDDRGWDGSMA